MNALQEKVDTKREQDDEFTGDIPFFHRMLRPEQSRKQKCRHTRHAGNNITEQEKAKQGMYPPAHRGEPSGQYAVQNPVSFPY
jgi:hypothetical protein